MALDVGDSLLDMVLHPQFNTSIYDKKLSNKLQTLQVSMGKGKYLRLLKPWQYDIDRQKKISIWWRMKSVLRTSSKVAEFNLS